MEVFSSSFSFLSFTPSSLSFLTRKTHLKSRKTHLKSSPNPPFSTTNYPFLKPCKPHIIARFGRPTNRRNSLRKKLIGDNNKNDSQVSEKSPNLIDPLHNFVDNQVNLDGSYSGIDSDKVGISDNGSKRLGDSVLWNKLESWVELYKQDIEFWGIGSNPIFTVFQDINGCVERVLVDEDEILRRSGVDPVYYKEESELEVFDEVNSKLSHAKSLARELESGKDVIPRNSSVAKFVVSGEKKSGFITRIKSVSVPKNLMPKVYGVGIAVVCGFVFVWAMKKLVALGGKKGEASSLEKEMLRRKVKARLEKGKLQKGNVEIVEEPIKSPVVIAERPHLDKEVVLDNIRRLKGLSNDLTVVYVGGAEETASVEMDFKIKEIQLMARRAREIEQGDFSANDTNDSNNASLGELQVEPLNSIESDNLEKQVIEERFEGDETNLLNVNDERKVLNSNPETEIYGMQEGSSCESDVTSKESCVEIEDVELHKISNGKVAYDKEHNEGSLNPSYSNGRGLSDVSSSQVSPAMKKPLRRMPRIIRSVQEAREYLVQKSDYKPLEEEISAIATSEEKEPINFVSQKSSQSDEIPVSFDQDMGPTASMSDFNSLEESKSLETDINGLTKVTAEVKEPINFVSQKLRQGDEAPVSIDHDRDFAASLSDFNSPEGSKSLETDISELNKDTLMEARTRDQEMDKDSSDITNEILGTRMNTDEMFRRNDLFNLSDTSGDRPDSSAHDTKPDVNDYLSSTECLDKRDVEMPKYTDLNGSSDSVLNRNALNDAGSIERKSDIPTVSDLQTTYFQERTHDLGEKGLAEVAGLEETPEPMTVRETPVPTEINEYQDSNSNRNYADAALNPESDGKFRKGGLFADNKNWLEKNFHEVEPIVNKIGSGFRDSYMVARDKVKQEVGNGLGFKELRSILHDTELEWMQDEKLSEIVFKVRDNELAGREPFHSMSLDDKEAFFKGLEMKVENENQKLSALHNWLHANIENVDYGADGISIYDPPEKVIPRWKGPPIDDIPEFLSDNGEQQQESSSLQKAIHSTDVTNSDTSQDTSTKSRPIEKASKSSKTLIEASDGSIKPGKKAGKEYWQHTKKWSRGFVESYNAETDPDVKSTMKDIGKGLDRWITEKEIQDAADLMDKLPQRGKDIVEKKIKKLKREMEMFGPQAVVSKYREYADEKEEDYLWWLDLPHVLCIELYTFEGEDQEIGFYTLEMAQDLELEPKPQHMIAFQDPSDCKNFCYIIQAHLEMLGKGKAFIVPMPPKDVFREAKANGFGVTVVRKGEVQLNVDQPLEEVEELIAEIGSKIYHDQIMKDRSVDISSLMKGVFGFNKPIKRSRKKRFRKRRSPP